MFEFISLNRLVSNRYKSLTDFCFDWSEHVFTGLAVLSWIKAGQVGILFTLNFFAEFSVFPI